MKVIVAGGRDFNDYKLLKETLDNFQQEYGNITEVVSGTAKGVDKLGEQYANENNIPIKRFVPDWEGFGNEGFHLDKDLLVKGNKVYSENTCVFIPREINSMLIKRAASRGKYLIGVHWCNTNKVFVAQVRKNKGKSEHLGIFKTEIEAFKAYKVAKEAFVKEQANKWKSQIDLRAYEALMNYQVEITD